MFLSSMINMECFGPKLAIILSRIQQGAIVKDDTLLDKLEDLIYKSTLPDSTYSAIRDFLGWCAGPDSEPHSVSLAVSLSSQCLIQGTSPSVDDMSRGFLEEVPDSDLWKTASVRSAWIIATDRLYSKRIFLKDYVKHIWPCLWDSSLFVRQAASRALCERLIKLRPTVEKTPDQEAIIEKLASLDCNSVDMIPVLALINQVCEKEWCSAKALLYPNDIIWLTKIETLLTQWPQITNKHIGLNFIANYICLCDVSEIPVKTEEFIIKLVLRSDVVSAVKLAAAICTRGYFTVGLGLVARASISYLTMEPFNELDNCVKAVMEALKTIPISTQLIACSVSYLTHMMSCNNVTVVPLVELLRCCNECDHRSVRLTATQRTRVICVTLDALNDMYIKHTDKLCHSNTGQTEEVVKEILKLLQIPSLKPVVVDKLYACLNEVLDSVNDGLLNEKIGHCILRHTCDSQWENRDSALQFCQTSLHKAKGIDTMSWLKYPGVTPAFWQCLDDTEAYVRASAIFAIGRLFKVKDTWLQFKQDVSWEKILDRLVTMMNSDPSEFPRRATVTVFHEWYKAGILEDDWSKVTSHLPITSLDADWEVKLGVLEFWETILQRNYPEIQSKSVEKSGGNSVQNLSQDNLFSSNGHMAEENLNSSGIEMTGLLRFIIEYKLSDVILLCLNDPEQTVKLKACNMAKNLLKLNVSGFLQLQDSPAGDNTDKDFIDKVFDFVNVIKETDLDGTIHECSMSTDEHNRHPVSLLDDIIASLQMAAQDEEDQGVIIDCY